MLLYQHATIQLKEIYEAKNLGLLGLDFSSCMDSSCKAHLPVLFYILCIKSSRKRASRR